MSGWRWVRDRVEWQRIVEADPNGRSIYADRDYAAAVSAPDADLRLLVIEEGTDWAAIPLRVLSLDRSICDESWVAAESPPGYPGVVGDEGVLGNALPAVLGEAGVVSLFLRLPPWRPSALPEEAAWSVWGNGMTAAIPLTEGRDAAFSGPLCRTHRNQVGRGRRLGLQAVVSEAPDLNQLVGFGRLYASTMKRLSASEYYLPPPMAWAAYADELSDRTALVTVVDEDGADQWQSLLLRDSDWGHYHLSARHEDAHNSAASVGFEAIADWASAHRLQGVHLGAGVGGANEGGLWAFKSRIGRVRLPLRFVGCVGDQRRHELWRSAASGSRFQSYVAASPVAP